MASNFVEEVRVYLGVDGGGDLLVFGEGFALEGENGGVAVSQTVFLDALPPRAADFLLPVLADSSNVLALVVAVRRVSLPSVSGSDVQGLPRPGAGQCQQTPLQQLHFSAINLIKPPHYPSAHRCPVLAPTADLIPEERRIPGRGAEIHLGAIIIKSKEIDHRHLEPIKQHDAIEKESEFPLPPEFEAVQPPQRRSFSQALGPARNQGIPRKIVQSEISGPETLSRPRYAAPTVRRGAAGGRGGAEAGAAVG